MTVPGRGAPPALRRSLGAALLVIAVLLAYLPALRAGFLDVWDDGEYVSRNPVLSAPGALVRIWTEPRSLPQYYPLVFTSFWAERQLWGLDPRGYHAVNVALHAANALLLWRVLAALGVPGAFVAALLFGVHPVHVESVAWITERKNLLSGLLYLLAAAQFLRFFRLVGPDAAAADVDGAPERRRWDRYGFGLLLFAGALFSKTVTASLPLALLLVLWWRRGRVAPRDLLALAPLLALGAALGLVTAGLEREHVGAVGAEWAFTLPERFLIAGRALWFYLGKLAWPHPTIFIYPRWDLGAAPGWQLLLFPGYFALLALAWARRRLWGRGPLAAGLFFVVTLAPALGFLAVYPMRYSFVADHFQYLASIGPLALAAAALATLAARWPGGGRFRMLAVRSCAHAAPLAVAAVFGVLTWRQAHAYRDQESLCLETIAKNPAAWIAQLTLGNIRLDRWELAPAFESLGAALRLKPDDGEVQNLYGLALVRAGRPAEALPHFQAALRLDPDLPSARQNLQLAQGLLQSGWGAPRTAPSGGGR